MNINLSDGDYVIVKKGNKITAMGFNISKVTKKTSDKLLIMFFITLLGSLSVRLFIIKQKNIVTIDTKNNENLVTVSGGLNMFSSNISKL